MKIEIETATNGYIITIPPEYEDSIEKKIVIQEPEYNHRDTKQEELGVLEISCQSDRILNSKGQTDERGVQF